jgi:hypothetical protein
MNSTSQLATQSELYKELFIGCIYNRTILVIEIESKNNHYTVTAAPLDYGQCRALDSLDYFYVFIFKGYYYGHLYVHPEAIKSMYYVNYQFDPNRFVKKPWNWIIERKWPENTNRITRNFNRIVNRIM